MATLQDFRNERLRKLEELKRLGVNPYPAKANRTNRNSEIKSDFANLEGKTVSVVGRIKNIRKMGKIGFIVIKDETDSLQLFLSESELGVPDYANSELGFSEVGLLDSGDFVEASGEVFRTQTDEISIKVKTLRILTKALRPMPLAHEEFSDKEQRLRRRYIDLNVNDEVRERFIRRSKFWESTRQFLIKEGFIEINTPVLEHTTGGADANPFVTHMDSLDQDFYLRISHELPLKRLIGGGFEKVFDIGPRFRNENYSDEHLPEHVAMESYVAYQDYEEGMELYERMFKEVAQETWGTLKFKNVNGFEVDLEGEWPRIEYADIMRKEYDVDVFNPDLDQLKGILKKEGVQLDGDVNTSRAMDSVWKLIRKRSAGPFWMIHEPVDISPLAKRDPEDSRVAQRFHPVIAGTEMGNGYSELNDPVDQLDRFLEQQNMRDAGDDEAQMLDIDFVEMLEYGMPPTCGWGNSERVFWMFEGVTAREGVIFPNLRHEVDETTKKIYPEVNFDQKKKVNGEVPESADKHGTYKIYLNDCGTTSFEAKVEQAYKTEDGFCVVLDQTAFYPGGGGQACDLGEVNFDGGKLKLTRVYKDENGIVYHEGQLEGDESKEGQGVKATVDASRRLLNSRLHCAGHMIDYAVRNLNKNWKPGKGAHYPEMSFVEYDAKEEVEDKEKLARDIEGLLNGYIQQGGEVSVEIIPSQEVIDKKISDYIPQAALESYKAVHVVNYPGQFKICCGGTHVKNVSDIGEVKITKIKKKDGNLRISYELG